MKKLQSAKVARFRDQLRERDAVRTACFVRIRDFLSRVAS